MRAEFHFRPISYLNMSNSDGNLTEFQVSSLPNSEFPDAPQVIEICKEEEKCVSDEEVNKRCLGDHIEQVLELDESDDGFKTPSSSEHKIPVPKQCPPAPRKPRSPRFSRKRKSPSPEILQINFPAGVSEEVESMFPLRVQEDSGGRKIKRARREDDGA